MQEDRLCCSVRTLRVVEKGEELCHSYIPMAQPSAERRKQLYAHYRFGCACSRCSVSERRDSEDEAMSEVLQEEETADPKKSLSAGSLAEARRTPCLLCIP